MEHDETTYLKYLTSLRGSQTDTVQYHEALIKKFQGGQSFVSRFAPVIYVLDYTTKKYLYVDDACFDLFGYTAKQWKEEGIDGYLSKWHPADLHIMTHQIFPTNLQFLSALPPSRYEDIIFSYNYRVLNAKGEYINVLQRSCYVPGDEKGKPVATIGAAFEITHFKSDVSVVHTIEEARNLDGRFYNEILYKHVYDVTPTQQDTLLSTRELQILRHMAKGLSSKQIADKLGISPNTINNHRKNMLSRTGSKSSVELLKFALDEGYL
jgi:DNA-binding CsgD family transcriptional regulator